MKEEDVLNYLKCFDNPNEELNDKSKKIIDELFNYLKKRPIDISKKRDREYLINRLSLLFNNEISFYGFNDKINLKFTLDDGYLGEFNYNRVLEDGLYKNDSYYVSISLDSSVVDGLSYNLKERLDSLKYLIRSLSHELSHFRQFKMLTSGFSSVDNLRFAKEYLFSDEGFEHNFYIKNHDSFSIEANADYMAYQRLSKLLDYRFPQSVSKCSIRMADYLSSDIRNEYRSVNREKEIDRRVEAILSVKNNRFLLKKFPILMAEYDENGKSKNLSTLVQNMYKEISDIQKLNISEKDKNKLIKDTVDMYYVLIYKRLEKNNKDEINDLLNLIGKDNFNMMLSNIKEYYRQDRIVKSNIFKRKASIKESLDGELNYLNRSDGILSGIKVRNQNGGYKIVTNEEYVKRYIRIDTNNQKVKDIIVKYVLPRIPSEGIYILKDGTKILPNDFINNYLIYKLDNCNTLLDVIKLLKSLVLSSSNTTLYFELESINKSLQEKVSYLDKIRDTYLEKEGEMKL